MTMDEKEEAAKFCPFLELLLRRRLRWCAISLDIIEGVVHVGISCSNCFLLCCCGRASIYNSKSHFSIIPLGWCLLLLTVRHSETQPISSVEVSRVCIQYVKRAWCENKTSLLYTRNCRWQTQDSRLFRVEIFTLDFFSSLFFSQLWKIPRSWRGLYSEKRKRKKNIFRLTMIVLFKNYLRSTE